MIRPLKRHLSLADENKVILSYRGEAFQRIKPKNSEKIYKAREENLIDVRFNTNVLEIQNESFMLALPNGETTILKMI